ncbi:MAG: glycerol-3-phosphate responsive antiterminator, partial [Bacillota bacterium]
MTTPRGAFAVQRTLPVAHLAKHPAIPALRRVEEVDEAASCGAALVFFLTGSIYDLRDVVQKAAGHGQQVFCHLDLVQGIGKDPAGIRWLAREIGVRGVLTTRSSLIKAAKDEGLVAVQRLFVLDSESLKTGLSVIASSKPDAVEILPALVLPNIIHRLPVNEISPFIAGGLVETVPELEAVLATGALGVSTSKRELWRYKRNQTP